MHPRIATLLLPLLALGVSLSTALATPVSPASDLFERGVALVDRYYNGYSENKTDRLLRYEREALRERCELTPSICKASVGREVFADYLGAFEDSNLGTSSPDDYAAIKATTTGHIPTQSTYGLVLDDLGNDLDVIVDVASGSPAEQAGLQPGDRIVTVNGGAFPPDTGPDDFPELRLVVARGPVNAEVRREITLTRTSLAPQFLPTLYAPAGAPKGVLVLRIPSFGYLRQVGPRVHELVRAAQARGARAIILDLRGGSGGYFYECEMAAGAFIGPFQYQEQTKLGTFPEGWTGTRSLDAVERAFVGIAAVLGDPNLAYAYDLPQPARWTGQVAVLVDNKTGGCHEYMAYFLQHFGHVKVIGRATRGLSNTFDIALDLPDGGGLWLPIARALNPDGSPFPGWVTPDVVLSSDELQYMDKGIDPSLEAAYKALGLAPAR